MPQSHNVARRTSVVFDLDRGPNTAALFVEFLDAQVPQNKESVLVIRTIVLRQCCREKVCGL